MFIPPHLSDGFVSSQCINVSLHFSLYMLLRAYSCSHLHPWKTKVFHIRGARLSAHRRRDGEFADRPPGSRSCFIGNPSFCMATQHFSTATRHDRSRLLGGGSSSCAAPSSAPCMLLLGLHSSTVQLPPHQSLPCPCCARRARRPRRTTLSHDLLSTQSLISSWCVVARGVASYRAASPRPVWSA